MNMESFRMETRRHGAMGRFRFSDFARRPAVWTGRPVAFLAACAAVVLWAASGPLFHFSDTWQLVINTGTTIVTFLMVFLIQNTQNRDTEAMQIKLDELIRPTQDATNRLRDLAELQHRELEAYRGSHEAMAGIARNANPGYIRPSGSPELPHRG